MKAVLENQRVHVLLVMAAVLFGGWAYFYGSPTGEAVTQLSVGSIKVTVTPEYAAGGTEKFVVEYNGFGELDISGWVLTNTNGFSYPFVDLILTDGMRLTYCADIGGDTNCDFEWFGGDVWDDGSGTLELMDENGKVIIDQPYVGQGAGGAVVGQAEINRPVYDKNDKVSVCHLDNKDAYTEKAVATGPLVRSIENDKNNHNAHVGDVIPPFFFNVGEGIEYYNGLNWPDLRSVYDNGCQ